jgi:hypothetical protein
VRDAIVLVGLCLLHGGLFLQELTTSLTCHFRALGSWLMETPGFYDQSSRIRHAFEISQGGHLRTGTQSGGNTH